MIGDFLIHGCLDLFSFAGVGLFGEVISPINHWVNRMEAFESVRFWCAISATVVASEVRLVRQ